MVFKTEFDKLINREKMMEREILNLFIERENLKNQINRHQKNYDALEEKYLEFKDRKKPFDFKMYHLIPSEIEVIEVLEKERASNKEISEKLNIKESTVKQHLYRVFNKIGIDNRIQLIDLCEYSFD